jgi:hypothetical protein
MLAKFFVFVAAFTLNSTSLYADQTPGEKASETANDVKRSTKKTGHRIQEAVCAKGDAKCDAERAKHRMQEGSDHMKDKVKEVKDKID